MQVTKRTVFSTALGLMLTGASLSSLRAAQPFRVSLELVPAETLPGIPVSIHFTVTNIGTAAAAFPHSAELVVRTSKGEEFITWCNSHEVLNLKDWPGKIGAGETIERWFRTDGTFRKPEWLGDARFRRPGRFELQAFFDDSYIPTESFRGAPTTIEQVRQRGISSTIAVLNVREPTGIDAEAWQLMNRGRGWAPAFLFENEGKRLAEQVMKAYPLSVYAGWIAATGAEGTTLDHVEMLRAWLEKAPADAYTEWRQRQLAVFELGASDELARRDPQKSAALLAAAGARLNRLVRESADPELKKLARESLEYAEAREQSNREEHPRD